jgi:glutathione synthase/RimK-type ligase-like ATP-grasp enzyme
MTKPSILIPEGSSLSARQTISALGLAGYKVDICLTKKISLCTFSKFINKRYIVPKLSDNPQKYLDSIIKIIKNKKYDAIIPTHEHIFLFSAYSKEIKKYTNIITSPIESFLQVQGKVPTAILFNDLHIPQPYYKCIYDQSDAEQWSIFPAYLKNSYGTAGNGVSLVNDKKQLASLIKNNLTEFNPMIIQAPAKGKLQCQVQALYLNGSLVCYHSTTLKAVGIGHSQAARLSISYPTIKPYLIKLGKKINWDGAMAIDYFYDDINGPEFIEINPRMVEPMNAEYSNMNFPKLLLDMTLNKPISYDLRSRDGILSTSLLSMMLEIAYKTNSRKEIIKMVIRSLSKKGEFKNSREDLMPSFDKLSYIVLIFAIFKLLINPKNAINLSSRAIGDYSLSASAIQKIISSLNT